jgi:hypothetical protein
MVLALLLVPPRIDLEAHAEPVASVVRRLAEASGTSLLCAPDVGARRVTAIVDDEKAETIRDRLAQAVGAEWVDTPKGLRLEIPPRLRAADLRRHRQLRETFVREALAAVSPPEPTAWTTKEAEAAIRAQKNADDRLRERGFYVSPHGMTNVVPAGRAARRVLALIGPAALADIEWGEKRVWSTRRQGRYSRPLPNTAKIVARTFNAEYLAFQESLSAHPELGREIRLPSPSTMGFDMADPLTANATDVTISVTRRNFSPDLYVGVYLSSATGTVVNSTWITLEESWEAPTPPGPAGELYRALTKIKVRLSERAGQWLAGIDPKNRTRQAAEWLLNPERYEPLDLTYTDALRAVSLAKKVDLIAAVDDTEFRSFGGFTQASVLLPLFAPDGENVSVKDGWLVFRPIDPVEADQARLDRRVLGEYVRKTVAQGYESADAYSTLVQATNDLSDHPIANRYRYSLALERLTGAGMPDPSVLAVVRALSAHGVPEYRRSVAQLAPAEREAVARFLFERGRVRFPRPVVGQTLAPDSIDFLPNVGLAGGLPGDAGVALTTEVGDVAYQPPREDDGSGTHSALIPIALAATLAQVPGSSPLKTVERLRPGRMTRYRLTVRVGDRELSEEFEVHHADLSKDPVPFSQLPEPYRRRVEGLRKEIKG